MRFLPLLTTHRPSLTPLIVLFLLVQVGCIPHYNNFDGDADTDDGPGQCDPSCDPTLEECVQATTGEWVCAARMVAIPAGNFWMGCNETLDPYCNCPDSDECEYHEVTTSKYWIDVTEVTNAQYVEFLNTHGNSCYYNEIGHNCVGVLNGNKQVEENSGIWSVKGPKDDHPVVEVSWFGAKDYCEWRCPKCRLCSEAEWEKAARGGCEKYMECARDSRTWPWGSEFTSSCDGTTAVYSGCTCSGGTCEVGTHPDGKSLYQVHDMTGNVWEWVEDCWHRSDDGSPDTGVAWGVDCSGSDRVSRGGCFFNDLDDIRVPSRFYGDPSYSVYYHGFRCCRSE